MRFVSDTDSQILRITLGASPESAGRLVEDLGGLIGAVAEADADATLEELGEELDQIGAHVIEREAEYAAALEKLAKAIQLGEITLEQYREAAPRLLVQRAMAREPDGDHAPERVAHAVSLVKGFCAVGVELHLMTVDLVMNGKNISADANTLWDEEISCSTSAETFIGNSEVLLVTEEVKLRTAAAKVGASNRVISVRDYETLLGIP